MRIVKAGKAQVGGIARLFDLYRHFYDCEPDLDAATAFIQARYDGDESTLFAAVDDDDVLGFTQLYPSFCSVELMKIYILYDLYVDAPFRQSGIGAALMDAAADWARANNAGRIDLLTAKDNITGQRLYERKGYEIANENFHAYSCYLDT
ncbi:MAG: GNAT family N-acetyltransferase [Pseudomonadota bacterium]